MRCWPLAMKRLRDPGKPFSLFSRHHQPHHALLPVDRLVAIRARQRRRLDVRVALHAHHQVVARHVQAAALVVHAHHAEVAVGIVVVVVVVVGVGGGEVVGELLLLDLDEGGALGDELLEEGRIPFGLPLFFSVSVSVSVV